MTAKTALLIVSVLLFLSWGFIIHEYKNPKVKIEYDTTRIEYYRNTINILFKQKEFLKLQLKEKNKVKIITRYEAIHDTINLIHTNKVDSCYSAGIRQYEANRAKVSITRFK